jgi:hypothetical protein
MKLGLSIELLDYFTKKCPNQNETRLKADESGWADILR